MQVNLEEFVKSLEECCGGENNEIEIFIDPIAARAFIADWRRLTKVHLEDATALQIIFNAFDNVSADEHELAAKIKAMRAVVDVVKEYIAVNQITPSPEALVEDTFVKMCDAVGALEVRP